MISSRFNSLSASGVMGLAKCCNGSTVTRMSGVLGSRVRRFEGFFTCRPQKTTSEFYCHGRGNTKRNSFNKNLSMSHLEDVVVSHLKIPCTSKKASWFLPTSLPAFLNSNQHFAIGTAKHCQQGTRFDGPSIIIYKYQGKTPLFVQTTTPIAISNYKGITAQWNGYYTVLLVWHQ